MYMYIRMVRISDFNYVKLKIIIEIVLFYKINLVNVRRVRERKKERGRRYRTYFKGHIYLHRKHNNTQSNYNITRSTRKLWDLQKF